jgi:hypothetical protein
MNAFEFDGPQVMAEISAAFSQVLAESKAGRRATDIVERLGLDKTLAWRITEVAWTQNSLLVAEHIPGPEGIDLFLSAAGRRGASVTALDRVHEAVDRFRRLTIQHAGDRATLGTMLADLDGTYLDSKSLDATRRAAYRANVSLFGVKCVCSYHLDVIAPNSEDFNRLDFAEVRAFMRLARFSRNAAWMLGRARVHDADKPYVESATGPLDPETFVRTGAPLIERFCSQPLPQFRPSAVSQHMVNHYVSSGPIGLSGAIDLVSGEMVSRAGTVFGSHPGDTGDVFARLYTPCESLVQDLLIHNNLLAGPWRGITPTWRIVNELGSGYLYPMGKREKSSLPTPPLAFSGNASRLGARADVPEASEIVSFACQRLGHAVSSFTAHRAILTYPPIPATSVLGVVLPFNSQGAADAP